MVFRDLFSINTLLSGILSSSNCVLTQSPSLNWPGNKLPLPPVISICFAFPVVNILTPWINLSAEPLKKPMPFSLSGPTKIRLKQ